MWSTAGLTAWAAGAAAFYGLQGIGGVAPGLVVSVGTYLLLHRRGGDGSSPVVGDVSRGPSPP